MKIKLKIIIIPLGTIQVVVFGLLRNPKPSTRSPDLTVMVTTVGCGMQNVG